MAEDARKLSDYFSFDKILLDAPCSGSGTENVFGATAFSKCMEKYAITNDNTVSTKRFEMQKNYTQDFIETLSTFGV